MIRNIGYVLISAAMLFGYSYAQDASPGGGGKQTEATFYGQKIDSKRIVFVIDHSGSMAEPADWQPGKDGDGVSTGGGGKSDGGNAGGGGGGRAGDNEKPDGDRKIDILKFELKRAIKNISQDTLFSIVYFDTKFEVWKDELVKATKENKDDALKLADSLQPAAATNIFDSLEKAFSMQANKKDAGGAVPVGGNPKSLAGSGTSAAGGGVVSAADTIYLLTDGLPNVGQVTDPNLIREKVKEMNQVAKVRINTIWVAIKSGEKPVGGGDADQLNAQGESLLKGLAEDNGGTFVKR